MSDPRDEYPAPSFERFDNESVAVQEQPQPERLLRSRPVVVTGAAGMVGSALCELLARDGWKVRGVVRNAARAAERLGHLPLEIRVGDVRDVTAMRSALAGAGTLVHLAAIAIERPGESWTETNTDGTRVVLDSAKAEGVERIFFMSQNGADSRSPHGFLRSKGLAQEMVQQSGSRWSVLRPSVIFGPEDEFVNVLARMIRLSPLVFPLPGGGAARFQPVALSDVVRAVAKILTDESTVRRSYDIGGAMPLTLREMTERILIAMSATRTLVSVPVGAIRPLVAILQRLLPSPPVTTDLLDLLERDNVVQENALPDLGIQPTPFAPEELLYLRKVTFSSALASLLRR